MRSRACSVARVGIRVPLAMVGAALVIAGSDDANTVPTMNEAMR